MTPDRDLIIIGAGGAGLSAAQYGARGNLRTLVLEQISSGGQALLIEGWRTTRASPSPSADTISRRRWRIRRGNSAPSSTMPP